MSKFIVIRKDVTLDPVVIESEGLTVGRLIGNDLALNHPTVSRTHAGIKEIEGDYWIFNSRRPTGRCSTASRSKRPRWPTAI